MQGAVAFDGEAGYATVDQRDGARLERPAVSGNPLVDGYLGVGEVGHHRVDIADDDQHRQGEHPAKVGVGNPHGGKGLAAGTKTRAVPVAASWRRTSAA